MCTIRVNPVAVYGTALSSLENAFSILALFEPSRPVLRVGEVCRDLGLPKSSVSRLMKAMGEFGLIEREVGDLGYVVGRRALELADLYLSRHTLLDLIDLTVDRIVSKFEFAGYSGILSGRDLVVLRVKHGAYPLRLVHPVGQRIPAYETAIGRALLARVPEDEALAAAGPPAGVTKRELRDSLDSIYRCGIAATISTTIPGIAALGAAVYSADKREAIGFAISFPIRATDAALRHTMASWLREEAASVAARIGDPYWAGRAAGPIASADLEAIFDPPADAPATALSTSSAARK